MLQIQSGWPLRPAALLLCLALPAAAQAPDSKVPAAPAAAAKAARPDPLEAGTAVPQLRYQPAFAGYKGIDAQPVGSWKDANDLTAKIGGWRSYARQAREGDAAAMSGDKAGAAMPADKPADKPAHKPGMTMPAGHGHVQHKSP